MLLSHLGYPANVFIFFGLTFFATPCLAALIVDPSCNQYSREVYQAIADVQAVTDKAYRRLLAIKTGDTKAAATYKVFFGKDGNPEAKLDTTAWQRHFLGWHQLEPEYFIHPGRVVDVFDRMRRLRDNRIPIRVECKTQWENLCDEDDAGAFMLNRVGPEGPSSTILLCSGYLDDRSFYDTRPATRIAREGLKRFGAVSNVASLTSVLIHELAHACPIGGGYMHPLYVEYGYNQGFIGDWSYGFDGCYDLANHPNPLKPYREPETNADSYATLAMALYLDEYDWSTGEVDTATGKPIPRPSWWSKLDRAIKYHYVVLDEHPVTSKFLGGSDRGSSRYYQAYVTWLESQNANVRREYRDKLERSLVRTYQVPLKAVDCLAEKMIPLKGRPVLWPLDPRLVEWRKQCGAPPLDPRRFLQPNSADKGSRSANSAKKRLRNGV